MGKTKKVEGVWPSWVTRPLKGQKFVIFEKIKRPQLIPQQLMPPAAVPGGVRVLKIHHRFGKVSRPELRKAPKVEGYKTFNVCANQGKYHRLSPRILGPVPNTAGPEWGISEEEPRVLAHNIEDAWQGLKVPENAFSAENPPEGDGWVPAFMEYSRNCRRVGGAKRHQIPAAQRRKFNAENPNVPRFSYYLGERLSYGKARGPMYCTWYEALARDTVEFQNLRTMHLAGTNIVLLDYDGLDREDPEQNKDLTRKKLEELYANEDRPFGHGLVLAACILGHKVWEKE